MSSDAHPDSLTAYRHWDAVWGMNEGHTGWSRADPWVMNTVRSLNTENVRMVLDLGCGIGRHAIFLASQGLNCYALDRSESGIIQAQQAARQANVAVQFAVGSMHDLPYDTASFDYVLAFNVVYHGDETAVGATLAEIRRVLRRGGIYQSTMLSKRNLDYGAGIEVSVNTFRQPNAQDDKVHPHLYCNAHDLLHMHLDMELLSASDRDQGGEGSFHWHCLFEATPR